MPLTHRAVHRNRAVDLTPWCAAVAGDPAGLELPDGYRIVGNAKTPAGPYHLALYRPGHPGELSHDRMLTDRIEGNPADVRTWLGILVDLAYIDARERTVTVTTDGAGWVRSIEDVA